MMYSWNPVIGKKGTKDNRKINVGKVSVGGNSLISVQSMTNTLTTDVKGTVKQINLLENPSSFFTSFY